MKPALLWNFEPDPSDELVNYYFVIINRDSKEIGKITNRLYEKFNPIIETSQRNGNVKDLQYRILLIKVNKVLEPGELSKVYGGKNIKKDERIYSRCKDSLDGLENYVISEINKNK